MDPRATPSSDSLIDPLSNLLIDPPIYTSFDPLTDRRMLPSLRLIVPMLLDLKRIEDNPVNQFQTESLQLPTLNPMYPNVIIVDQKAPWHGTAGAGSLPDSEIRAIPHQRLFISSSLTEALAFVFKMEEPRLSESVNEGWSIVLKEGMYFDPRACLRRWTWNRNLTSTLEIVGLNDVRIVFIRDGAAFAFEETDVTLRNIRIYDRRDSTDNAKGTLCAEKSNVKLLNVKITSLFGFALFCCESTVFLGTESYFRISQF